MQELEVTQIVPDNPSQEYIDGLDLGRLIEDKDLVYKNLIAALYHREASSHSREVGDFIDGFIIGLIYKDIVV
jgi:hypothetical protein